MGLVDYASDSDSDSGNESKSIQPPSSDRPAKRARTEDIKASLPPLPSSFHDLYASTVRTSTADDPSLHQGRVRQIPHIAGNWPSHVYIEWHPPAATYTLLTGLLSALQEKSTADITTFLTSDLGAPLPLHISLSRPITLTTADKDNFLEQLISTIKGSNISPFELAIRDVEWHRTEESGRSFLVLRLEHCGGPGPDPDPDLAPGPTTTTPSTHNEVYTKTNNKNPELTELLRRCNQTATRYGQPALYQWASDGSSTTTDENTNNKPSVGDAFHISIAWSFSKPTEDLKLATKEVFGDPGGKENGLTCRGARVQVDGVKAKIGNVVTHIPLPQPGSRNKRKGSKQMFGLT